VAVGNPAADIDAGYDTLSGPTRVVRMRRAARIRLRAAPVYPCLMIMVRAFNGVDMSSGDTRFHDYDPGGRRGVPVHGPAPVIESS